VLSAAYGYGRRAPTSACAPQVANAMAAKLKLLQRELKALKADLSFSKEWCAQLEEENRLLRDGNHDADEDLVRRVVPVPDRPACLASATNGKYNGGDIICHSCCRALVRVDTAAAGDAARGEGAAGAREHGVRPREPVPAGGRRVPPAQHAGRRRPRRRRYRRGRRLRRGVGG
jgi:hypothetical protein